MPSEPDVTGHEAGFAPKPEPTGPLEPFAEPLSPTTEIAFPVTVTGAATTGATCVPEPVPSEPDVTGPEAEAGAAAGAAASVVVPSVVAVDEESPAALTALPVSSMGTSTLMRPCVPPSSELFPVVIAGAWGAAGAEAGAGAVDPVELESPSTEMALPETLTGAATGATT